MLLYRRPSHNEFNLCEFFAHVRLSFSFLLELFHNTKYLCIMNKLHVYDDIPDLIPILEPILNPFQEQIGMLRLIPILIPELESILASESIPASII